MRTITEAKKIWKSKPYSDEYINIVLKQSDEYWNTIIIGAIENEKNINSYIKDCEKAGIAKSKEDLAIDFLKKLVEYHKENGVNKSLIIPSIMLMSNWISDIWIGYEMMSKMVIYKVK